MHVKGSIVECGAKGQRAIMLSGGEEQRMAGIENRAGGQVKIVIPDRVRGYRRTIIAHRISNPQIVAGQGVGGRLKEGGHKVRRRG